LADDIEKERHASLGNGDRKGQQGKEQIVRGHDERSGLSH
jgi:hypothetical protein